MRLRSQCSPDIWHPPADDALLQQLPVCSAKPRLPHSHNHSLSCQHPCVLRLPDPPLSPHAQPPNAAIIAMLICQHSGIPPCSPQPPTMEQRFYARCCFCAAPAGPSHQSITAAGTLCAVGSDLDLTTTTCACWLRCTLLLQPCRIALQQCACHSWWPAYCQRAVSTNKCGSGCYRTSLVPTFGVPGAVVAHW